MAETRPSTLLRSGFPVTDPAPDFALWFPSAASEARPEAVGSVAVEIRRGKPATVRSRPSDAGHGKLPGAAIFSESSGLEFGSVVHDLLAGIEWLPADLPKDAPAVVGKFLQHPEVKALFVRPSSEAVVWRERAVGWNAGGTLVSAQMDRVVIEPGEIVVVDFKTDQGDPEEIAGRYASQMRAYLGILAAWSGGRHSLRAVVATVRTPSVIKIPPK